MVLCAMYFGYFLVYLFIFLHVLDYVLFRESSVRFKEFGTLRCLLVRLTSLVRAAAIFCEILTVNKINNPTVNTDGERMITYVPGLAHEEVEQEICKIV